MMPNARDTKNLGVKKTVFINLLRAWNYNLL